MVRTPQNPTPFEWTGAKERAATLLADGELTDQEIAEEVGVNRWTLWSWKQHPDFAARVEETVQQLGAVARRYALGHKANRMARLQRRADALDRVIAERAADPAMQNVPGGKTGLLVRTVKVIGAGENAREVAEYRVDTGLLKEMRELEQQAAQEAGDWVEKGQVQGVVADLHRSVIPEIDELRKLPLEELMRIHREALGYTGPEEDDDQLSGPEVIENGDGGRLG